MKFIMFRTNKPRRFNYQPRYYDTEKEALERRKAEMGLQSKLTEQEKLRLKIRSRWHQDTEPGTFKGYKRLSMLIYAIVILSGLYLIFMTDMIDNLLTAFGVGK